MAQLDENAKVVKILINNDLKNNVNGSVVEDLFFDILKAIDSPQCDKNIR